MQPYGVGVAQPVDVERYASEHSSLLQDSHALFPTPGWQGSNALSAPV